MKQRRTNGETLFFLLFFVLLPVPLPGQAAGPIPPAVDRSPVDVALGPGEQWLVAANQTSGSVSLVRVDDGAVLDEVACGDRPAYVAVHPDGKRVLVTNSYGGDLVVLKVVDTKLERVGALGLGFEPHGIAISPEGARAYVALASAGQVAVVDLDQLAVVDRIEVESWPRYLALSPDGKRLGVGCSGSRGIAVVDTATRTMEFFESTSALNIGHLHPSRDGQHVYFPWMVYRSNPITQRNIRLGWVLASRIARVRLDESARREAISLDPPGEAVADPHGIAIDSNEQRMAVSSSGTHELLIYRLPDLPFVSHGGPGDLIDRALLADRNRFYRIHVGGRPMGMRMGQDGRTVYVANYLDNSVQVVDLDERKLVRRMPLGGPELPSLARRGEAIFHDARRSLDQWYSCHSCHYDGGANAVPMDTQNDGSNLTYKTVLPLHHVSETAPWTWHGWQNDLGAAMRKSITSTMLGPPPTDEDVEALVAYLKELVPPRSSYREADGSLTPAAQRGEQVFRGERAGCIDCHSGPHRTDGKIHDIGLSRADDKYQGFNTPSLIGVHRRIRLLHDGRAKSLEEVLTGAHDPADVVGRGGITAEERRDLIEYLKSL